MCAKFSQPNLGLFFMLQNLLVLFFWYCLRYRQHVLPGLRLKIKLCHSDCRAVFYLRTTQLAEKEKLSKTGSGPALDTEGRLQKPQSQNTFARKGGIHFRDFFLQGFQQGGGPSYHKEKLHQKMPQQQFCGWKCHVWGSFWKNSSVSAPAGGEGVRLRIGKGGGEGGKI